MPEMSRIIIEEYCSKHNSKKSRRLWKLVTMSYDVECECSEADILFLDDLVYNEEDPEFREALQDLYDFMTGY